MTCNYTMLTEDDREVVLEIYHGDNPDQEHEIIRVVSADGMLSEAEIRETIGEYAHLYGVTDVSATISLEGIERV